MKLLLVSDLHYALPQFDWTTAVAPDFDLVVMAGDHLDIAGHVAGAAQTSRPRHYFIMLVYAVKRCHPDGHYPFKTMSREGGRRRREAPPAAGSGEGSLLTRPVRPLITGSAGCGRIVPHSPATFVLGQDMKGANLLRLGLKTVVRRVVPVVLDCARPAPIISH